MNTLKEQLTKRVADYDLWAQRRRYGPDGHNNRGLWYLLVWMNAYR
jgi:carbonic anhydrase